MVLPVTFADSALSDRSRAMPNKRISPTVLNTRSIERCCFSNVRSSRKELDASPIEFATFLQAARLLKALGFPLHDIEHTTKVMHQLRPSDSVDSQPFGNRLRFGWCRALFTINRIAGQRIEYPQILRFRLG